MQQLQATNLESTTPCPTCLAFGCYEEQHCSCSPTCQLIPQQLVNDIIDLDDSAPEFELDPYKSTEREIPRPYQLDGVEHLTTPNRALSALTPKCRYILTDPAGLGKTLQLIESAHKRATKSTLWLAPIFMGEDTYNYLLKQHPEDTICELITESTKNKLKYLADPDPCKWIIINYEALRNVDVFNALIHLLDTDLVDTLILDESQAIKNRASQQSKQAIKLCTHSHLVNLYLASATPVMREADDLFNQLHAIDADTFSSYDGFLREYCTQVRNQYGPTNIALKKSVPIIIEEDAAPRPPAPDLPKPPTAPDFNKLILNNPNLDVEQVISEYQEALSKWRISLSQAERDLQNYKQAYYEHKNYVPRPITRREWVPINDERALGKYMFGRSYEEVGLELPRLIENKRIVALNPEREREYKEMRQLWSSTIKSDPDFIINAANSMKAMHLLRMLASCDTKMEACFDIIEETPGPHLIYTVYDASSAEPLYALLNAKLRASHGENAVQCITGTRYPGSKGAAQRSNILTDPQTEIAVCTMSSVGKGLNLQRYNTVIFYEGDWTPGIMYQALTRVHRARKEADIRTTPVLAYYLLSKGTIDEGIHTKRNSRTNAAKDILKVELSRA